jgi:hypothetical protein
LHVERDAVVEVTGTGPTTLVPSRKTWNDPMPARPVAGAKTISTCAHVPSAGDFANG